jgi:pullulanase
MYETFGAREIQQGVVTFRLFFPDSSRDQGQYQGGGLPGVKDIRVVGDFQHTLGQTDWSEAGAGAMTELPPNPADPVLAAGHLFELSAKVPDGFYEYLYHVTYTDGTVRRIADPCSRYGGRTAGRSGFVVGGRKVTVAPIARRLPYRDLVLYELNIDDYTARLPAGQAPLDAITSAELKRIKDLGFNAIEFMPWTAWPTDGFSWGYNPYQYFSVSHVYTDDPGRPSDKLALLGDLINRCHALDLHVIMDGVFNHVQADPPDQADPLHYRGFGYYWLYRTTADSPFVGNFADHDFFRDLDYANDCTLSFIFDVCRFWIDNFKIDGIRFDNTLGFYKADDRGHGLPRLLADLRDHVRRSGLDQFATVLEHSWDYGAIDVTNKVGASSCWYDQFRSQSMDFLGNRSPRPGLMRMLSSSRDFDEDRVATIYLENHDHKAFALKASASRDEWWRMQPYLIALFTCPGAVMLHNGQEYANSYDMPESGDGRVVPRPIDWAALGDQYGGKVAALVTALAAMRASHPSLRAPSFHPLTWDESRASRDADGFGLDVATQVAVYHRWTTVPGGRTERVYVVLNFSDDPAGRTVALKVAVPGQTWTDLLTGEQISSAGYDLSVFVGRCWGRVLCRVD